MDAEQAGAFVLHVFAVPVENLGELHGALSLLLVSSLFSVVPRGRGFVEEEL